ncbi:hypothetical protein F5Y16DRAFT_51358 [Xylariaceae sp. FL0255]|nr:hypothetical protein F5Y16DRAFT_51358 [Xylariaceae sp. FL0255]
MDKAKPSGSQETSGGQSSKRKGGNSATRKEQNRKASRIYREKRRQKLALLDELLRTDHDSLSSASDETDSNYMAPPEQDVNAQCRASKSPTPGYLATPVPPPPPPMAYFRTLPSNSPDPQTGAYASHRANGLSDEASWHDSHHEPASQSLISTDAGLEAMYPFNYPPSAFSAAPAASFYPYNQAYQHADQASTYPSTSHYNTYHIPESTAPSASVPSESTNHMARALDSLSQLDEGQRHDVMIWLQRRARSPAPSEDTGGFDYRSY